MKLRAIGVVLLALLYAAPAHSEEWREADEALSRDVINCLIDRWVRESDQTRRATRYDLVVIIKSIDQYRVPPAKKERLFQKNRDADFFCEKGKQRDYHALLKGAERLVITNGRPTEADGEIRGYAYGIMDVYVRGQELAIYVQQGGYFRRSRKNRDECVYNAMSGAERFYLGNREHTIAFVGAAHLWVADVMYPDCWEKK